MDTDADIFAPVWRGSIEEVRRLLDQNQALAAATDRSPAGGGQQPLHIAAYAGHADMVNILLKHGARVEAQNDAGCTPLLLAAQQGHEQALIALLDAGARADACTPEHQLTPLDCAASARIVRLLNTRGKCAGRLAPPSADVLRVQARAAPSTASLIVSVEILPQNQPHEGTGARTRPVGEEQEQGKQASLPLQEIGVRVLRAGTFSEEQGSASGEPRPGAGADGADVDDDDMLGAATAPVEAAGAAGLDADSEAAVTVFRFGIARRPPRPSRGSASRGSGADSHPPTAPDGRLWAGTAVVAQARLRNGVGWGPWSPASSIVACTLPPDKPDPPRLLGFLGFEAPEQEHKPEGGRSDGAGAGADSGAHSPGSVRGRRAHQAHNGSSSPAPVPAPVPAPPERFASVTWRTPRGPRYRSTGGLPPDGWILRWAMVLPMEPRPKDAYMRPREQPVATGTGTAVSTGASDAHPGSSSAPGAASATIRLPRTIAKRFRVGPSRSLRWPGEASQARLPGIEPGISYAVTLQAVCPGGTSASSDPLLIDAPILASDVTSDGVGGESSSRWTAAYAGAATMGDGAGDAGAEPAIREHGAGYGSNGREKASASVRFAQDSAASTMATSMGPGRSIAIGARTSGAIGNSVGGSNGDAPGLHQSRVATGSRTSGGSVMGTSGEASLTKAQAGRHHPGGDEGGSPYRVQRLSESQKRELLG